MKCEKVDLRKVNLSNSLTHNIWIQFSINLDTTKRKIDVTKHYMPQKEQDKLVTYMLSHYRKLSFYRGYYRSKTSIRKEFAWEILANFPNSVNR